jgi:hypothetical protein
MDKPGFAVTVVGSFTTLAGMPWNDLMKLKLYLMPVVRATA